MNCVMTGAGQFVEVQATAEQRPFSDAQLAEMLGLARKGIGELLVKQSEVLAAAGVKF